MQLLLLRHADAAPSARTDDLRPLTDKGRQQAHRVARFCKQNDIRPELILSSPFLRAEQTARILSDELGSELVLSAFLAAGMMPFAAMDELRSTTRFESVMLVGHEPDLGELAGALLGAGNAGAIRFRKATLASLDVESFTSGGANLEFLVPAKLL